MKTNEKILIEVRNQVERIGKEKGFTFEIKYTETSLYITLLDSWKPLKEMANVLSEEIKKLRIPLSTKAQAKKAKTIKDQIKIPLQIHIHFIDLNQLQANRREVHAKTLNFLKNPKFPEASIK